ncbi:MAG: hypothetical protein GQ470_00700, partial [Gammaproteobacteria bacterium]|nr:hypothetical protein [Gammaproteobacteria bacterium]
MIKFFFKVIGYTLLLLTGLSVVAYFSVTTYVNYQLDQRSDYRAYDSCHKVWSARGLYQTGVENGVVENSIESVARAFAKGAGGVEIDVHYDVAMKKFIVSHGYRYREQKRPLLTLKEIFDAVGNEGYYWLDYKN